MNDSLFQNLQSQEPGNSNIINKVNQMKNRKISQASKNVPMTTGSIPSLTPTLASALKTFNNNQMQEELEQKQQLADAKNIVELAKIQKELNTPTTNLTTNNPSTNTGSREDYIKKLWKIESNNDINAKNKNTGALSYNQVLPKYRSYYEQKAGIQPNQFLTEEGQRKISNVIYDDTTKFLKQNNYPDTYRNRYLVHQQGRQGFKNLMNGKYNESALAQNIPTSFLMKAPEKESMLDTYLRYWDSKFI